MSLSSGTVIDEKIVSMTFDNAQFEKGVSQSMSTLDKLKSHLSNLPVVGSALSKIGEGVKTTGLDAISESVDKISSKFNLLGLAGMNVLQDIARKAVTTGEQMVKSLTVEPIADGWNEYSLKMGSVQTIMAGTGESLDVVMDKLNELNKYSDKTIYSFADMTQNIGKFTNAGVKLDDAVGAIQGVANVAAVSGANAGEASRAMYNFAQALSAGYVKLIDWKSIENANMATVEFKDQLIQTAVAMGTLKDNADGTYSVLTKNAAGSTMKEAISATRNFNDSLGYQWMTTEVLTQTLNQYSTDLSEMTDAEKEAYREQLRGLGYTEEQIKKVEEISSKAFAAATEVKTFSQLMDTLKESVGSGWAETFEMIFGNFNEAKKLWTDINNALGDILQKSADARNDLVKGWKELGGRDSLIKSFWHIFNSVVNIAKEVKKSFQNIFPPATAKSIYDLTLRFEEFTRSINRITVRSGALSTFRDLLNGVFATTSIVIKVFKKLVETIMPIGEKYLTPIATKIKDIISKFATWATETNKLIDSGDSLSEMLKTLFGNFIDGLKNTKVIGPFISGIEKVFDVLKNVFSAVKSMDFGLPLKYVKTYQNAGGGIAGGLNVILSLLQSAIEKAMTFIEKITGIDMSGVTSKIVDGLHKARHAINDFFAGFKDSNSIFETLKDTMSKFSGGLGKIIGGILDSVNWDGLSGIFKVLLSIFTFLSTLVYKVFSGIVNGLKNIEGLNLTSFMDFMSSLLSLVASGILVKIVKGFGSLKDGLDIGNIGESISKLVENLNGLSDGIKGVLNSIKVEGIASAALMVASAIFILAVALLLLAGIDQGKLYSSITAITTLFIELGVAVKNMASIDGAKGVIKLSASLILISVAVLILAAALKMISALEPEALALSIAGITGLVADLVATAKLLPSGTKGMIALSLALILFSFAVKNISKALINLSEVKGDDLVTAGAAIAGVMGALTTIAKVLSTSKLSAEVGASILLMAFGVSLIASAIGKIAAIGDVEMMLTALGIIGAIMGGFILMARLMDKTDLTKTAKGILLISASLWIVAKALQEISEIDSYRLVPSLLVLAYALGAIGVFSKIVNPDSVGKIGFGLILLAAGFYIIAKAIAAIGSMELGSLAKGLLGFALSMGIMIGAVALLDKIGSAKGAGAILVMAIAIKILAGGLKTLGSLSLSQLGTALIAVVGALVVLGLAASVLTPVIPALIGISIALALLGVAVFAVGAGVALLAVGLGALAVSGAAGIAALGTALGTVIAMIPQIIASIVEGFVQAISVIVEHIDEITKFFVIVLQALVAAFTVALPQICEAVLSFIIQLLAMLAEHTPEIVSSVVQIALGIIEGFIQGLADGIPGIVEAGTNLIINLMEAFTASKLLIVNKAFEVMIEFINGLAEAIEVNTPLLEAAIERLFNAVVNAATTLLGSGSTIGEFIDAGKNLIGGIIDGIKSKIEDVKDAIKSVGDAIKKKWNDFWDIHSPSKVAKEMAGYVGDGLVEGFESKEGEVADASEGLGETASSSMGGALSKIKDALDFDIMNDSDLEPVITPVVDLSNIKSSSKEINSMLDNPTYTANATTSISTNNADSVKQQNTLAGMHLQIVEMNKMLVNIMKSINDIEIPETNVDVELSPNAKALFKVNQKESTNYRKRTGRPAYQTM